MLLLGKPLLYLFQLPYPKIENRLQLKLKCFYPDDLLSLWFLSTRFDKVLNIRLTGMLSHYPPLLRGSLCSTAPPNNPTRQLKGNLLAK